MSYDWCRECYSVHKHGNHLPLWELWRVDPLYEETREDCRTIRAIDEEDAVEKWAAEDDRNDADYAIVSGSPALVFVAAPGKEPTRWSVSGELVPSYSAIEINA